MTEEQGHYGRGQHPNSRANLRMFQPGQSGNPSGSQKRTSIVQAINEELRKPLDPEHPDGMTQLEAVAIRVMSILLKGKDVDSLSAAKFVTGYVDGQPTQYIELDMRRMAQSIADKTGINPQALLDRADEIGRETLGEALREQALSEPGAFDDDD